LHKLRKCSGLAAGLIAVFLLACPRVEWSQAQAQTHTAAKKKAERKAAAPKGAEERATFTAQDQDAAVIPGISDARVWGDSESEFARLLPPATGPWLAISGGGSDGAYGAGVLTGWSEAGTRPEFAVVTGVSIGALIAPFAFLGPRYDEELHKIARRATACSTTGRSSASSSSE
jgi:patatin-like phospholipase